MEEEKDVLTSVVIWILVAVVYYFVRVKFQNAGQSGLNTAIVEIGFAALCISSGKVAVWFSRYYMPKVCVNNFSGSILGKPVSIKDDNGVDWAIFNTGESLEPVHLRGKLATLIVPLSAIKELGSNWAGSVFVKKTPLNFTPPVAYNYLVHHSEDYNLENVYFGKFSTDFETTEPVISDYEEKIQALHSQINFRNDIIENRNDQLFEMYELGKKLSGNEKRWYDFLKRSKTADEQ